MSKKRKRDDPFRWHLDTRRCDKSNRLHKQEFDDLFVLEANGRVAIDGNKVAVLKSDYIRVFDMDSDTSTDVKVDPDTRAIGYIGSKLTWRVGTNPVRLCVEGTEKELDLGHFNCAVNVSWTIFWKSVKMHERDVYRIDVNSVTASLMCTVKGSGFVLDLGGQMCLFDDNKLFDADRKLIGFSGSTPVFICGEILRDSYGSGDVPGLTNTPYLTLGSIVLSYPTGHSRLGAFDREGQLFFLTQFKDDWVMHCMQTSASVIPLLRNVIVKDIAQLVGTYIETGLNELWRHALKIELPDISNQYLMDGNSLWVFCVGFSKDRKTTGKQIFKLDFLTGELLNSTFRSTGQGSMVHGFVNGTPIIH